MMESAKDILDKGFKRVLLCSVNGNEALSANRVCEFFEMSKINPVDEAMK